MSERLFGIETEYAAAPVRACHTETRRQGLLRELLRRAHAQWRCVPDIGGSGVFLQNGGRFYVDCGSHPELTTPEVANPWDAVRYVLAGERMLEQLLAGPCGVDARPLPLLLFKSNVDYTVKTTWGCHESVLHSTHPGALAPQIIPHLVARVIFTGAGGFNPRSPGLEFMVSPRAAFLEQQISSSSTHTRGIFHTKNESLANGHYGRLHILCGESLCSQTATWLKVATTVLVVAMIEGGLEPGRDLAIEHPLGALRAIAADPTCRATLRLVNGASLSALDIERRYLEQAETHAGAPFMPPWTETACQHWRAMLDRVDAQSPQMTTTLDWAIKRALFEQHAERRGFRWQNLVDWTHVLGTLEPRLQDCGLPPGGLTPEALLQPSEAVRDHMRAVQPLLESKGLAWGSLEAFARLRQELFEIDMRFGQLGGHAIFGALDRAGALTHGFPGVDNIPHAIEHPPCVGRARVRGAVIRRGADQPYRYRCYWDHIVDLHKQVQMDLSDPFETVERWAPCKGPGIPPPHAQGEASSADRRDDAYACFLMGDYRHAEEVLRELIRRRFDVAGTRCHLARALLMDDQQADARTEVAQAWAARAEAPPYVVARTLWLQALFAVLDGGDALPFLGQIKTLLTAGGVSQDWTTEPLLDHLRPHLPPDRLALLAAVAAALSDGSEAVRLEQIPAWCACGARAIEWE